MFENLVKMFMYSIETQKHKCVHFSGSRTKFKQSHRSEFLTNLDDRMCVGKLRSRRIQKNKSHFMCTHRAQNTIKISTPNILAILRAKCTQEKNDMFFWILRDLSFLTHTRWSKSNKNSLLCDILKFGDFFFDPSLENFHKGGSFLKFASKF